MGVHGLTTYLRENIRALGKVTETSGQRVPVVIDAWSFIFKILSEISTPWVYGGEHAKFAKAIRDIINAWTHVGFYVYFVFDGSRPSLKFETLINRLRQSNIHFSELIFRTSEAARPHCTSRDRATTPLVYTTCVATLQSLQSSLGGVEIHMADEEGDPYSVELAGRVGGYVIGSDSDFVVLNTEGYLGYIPLDEMVWNSPVKEEEALSDIDGEFQVVRKPKRKRRFANGSHVVSALVPPENLTDVSLTFTSYHPSTLASHLRLPINLLPLLGAIVGNDFSKQQLGPGLTMQAMLFERSLSLSNRIARVAATIETILSASSQKKNKLKYQIGSVVDLIDKTINSLLSRNPVPVPSGQVVKMVDMVAESTLQYAIPKSQGSLWPSKVCALHHPESCPILPLFSRSLAAEASDASEEISPMVRRKNRVRSLYVSAYRKGILSPLILDTLTTGTYWPRLFVENPDIESVSKSIGRGIRQFIYAIVDDAVGLPERLELVEQEIEANGSATEDLEDEDEIIDVIEEDSDAEDLLAPLKGQLNKLHTSDDEESAESITPSTQSRAQSRLQELPKVILEYVRRGSRIIPDEVLVPSIEDLPPISHLHSNSEDSIPLLMRSLDERFTAFLALLDSDLPSIRALPQEQLLPALSMRWVVRTLNSRARDSGGNKEREKERWTLTEGRYFLSSFSWLVPVEVTAPYEDSPPPIVDRNLQLMAQALMALDTIQQLSEVLLLGERVPAAYHLLSGRAFHQYMTGVKKAEPNAVPVPLWDACVEGIEEAFAKGRSSKVKRKNKGKAQAKTQISTSAMKGSIFALLADE